MLFSKEIRAIGFCAKCGTTLNLQCSHVISRTVLPLRCDPDNAICLCYKCHIFGWHKDPMRFARWFEWLYPGRYDRLLLKEQVKLTVDWRATYEKLSNKKGSEKP